MKNKYTSIYNHKVKCQCCVCKNKRGEGKGRILSKEHKKRIGLGNKGKKRTEEQINRIRNYIHKSFTKEQRKKYSDLAKQRNFGKWMLGRHFSEETKLKMSLAHKGKHSRGFGFKCSEETKLKMSLAHKGIKKSKKHCENIRKARIGYKYSLESRKKMSESHIGLNSLEKHPNWQGGKSYEIYPLGWNRTYKEQIRRRDEYKCQECEVPEIELNRKLHIHHKDLNKQNINSENLISLCQSCHCKLHWKIKLQATIIPSIINLI